MSRRQKRLVAGTAGALLLAVTAWEVYSYVATAEQRSAAAFREGLSELNPGDYNGAVARFSEAVRISPRNAGAYLQRGNAQNALGNTEEALADWTRAIEINPRLAAAYTARGTVYRMRGEYDKALAELNKSLAIDPGIDAYYQRGELYHSTGEYAKAVEDFDRGIAEMREAPFVYRARSAARKALGDLQGAAADRAQADELEKLH